MISIIGVSQSSSKIDSLHQMQIYQKCVKTIDKSSLKLPDVIIEVAQFFLDKPYVSSTLEVNEKEKLVLNLQQFDCNTFVDNVLAISLSICDSTGEAGFLKKLQEIRYRNGEINGYTSRIHYFTEWILENQKNGRVKDITKEIGGKPYLNRTNFMSEHPQYYPALRDTNALHNIKKIENKLHQQTLFYIPKLEVSPSMVKIKTGDIITFTTSIKGLDVVHVGFAVKRNRQVYLLHASSDYKKVMLTDVTIHQYINNNKKQSGIIVARPL